MKRPDIPSCQSKVEAEHITILTTSEVLDTGGDSNCQQFVLADHENIQDGNAASYQFIQADGDYHNEQLGDLGAVFNNCSPQYELDSGTQNQATEKSKDDSLNILMCESLRDYECNQFENLTPTSENDSAASLTKVINTMILKLIAMDAKLNEMMTLMITPQSDNFGKAEKIPVETEEDLQYFDKKLEDETFRAHVVSYLYF